MPRAHSTFRGPQSPFNFTLKLEEKIKYNNEYTIMNPLVFLFYTNTVIKYHSESFFIGNIALQGKSIWGHKSHNASFYDPR